MGDKKQAANSTVQKMIKRFSFALIAVSVASILGLIFSAVSNPNAAGPIYLALININLIFAIAVIFFIGRMFIMLFIDRKKGFIGTRLHVRLLAIFSTLAVLPAIMVGAFSIFLLNHGIESWFSSRVTRALDGSLEVARSYLSEHEKNILIETRAIAQDSKFHSPSFVIDPEYLTELLEKERKKRSLADLRVYNTSGALISYTGIIEPLPLPLEINSFFAAPTEQGMVVKDIADQRILSAYPLTADLFLVVSRLMNAAVLARVDSTQEAYQEYYELRSQRDNIRLVFTLFLILLTASALAAAIWVGLKLAERITKPVTSLVHATNKVSTGDLDVRVPPVDDDELGILTQSFNRMASQLQEYRELLERKNRELGDRRRITEAVLTGVSAGVFSLDCNGKVLLANKVAQDTLGVEVDKMLLAVSPELQEMFENFQTERHTMVQEKMRINNGDDESRTLLVRMVPQYHAGGKLRSVVVTFDDITELLTAQKVAAWSDVAQRIAHEIKNPLTPIQLSAERLSRKYKKDIPEDSRELFNQLTATIVRQVEDMRVMVNEFSDFARMPQAVMQEENLVSILNEIIVLQRVARPDIEFEASFPKDNKMLMSCDASHISRAYTNLIENAVNAIQETDEDAEKVGKREVKVVVEKSQHGTIVTSIADTGRGLPDDVETDKLFDPYVTTRKKGTGLGLAIVRRVVDEHGGQIRLMRREEGGTCVEITFPLKNIK